MEDGEGAGGGVAEPGQDHGAGGGAVGVARHAVRLLPVRVGRRPGHQQQTGQDGQLFEIKHLLILREQIAPFQVDFKVKETSLNFGQIKTAAVSLINHR